MNITLNVNQEGNTLFGGNLFKNGNEMDVKEQIAKKRQLYLKQGNKLVKDADAAERRIDKSIEDTKGRVKEAIDHIGEYSQGIKDLDEQLAQLKEQCGVEDDSQEQKDLEILLKLQRNQSGISGEELTKEEMDRLKEMGGATDYQKAALELYKQRDDYTKKTEQAKSAITAMNKGILQINIDRLQTHGMIDAQKSKEELMDAASQEIIGMLMDDAKENIDKKTEELEEAAEKREEKKEEMEERLEAVREDKAQAEAQVEAARESVEELTEQMTKSEDIVSEVESETKKLMELQEKMEEALKGIIVDRAI